ncbi:uncharacterized protein NECHADRAFT_87026 [Fusarium vanettenii 77-13-4]|uniref:Ribonuclease H1 N-terminal domain-containing protein n=1 Tax=Fusarium vanettenii (strain ATCC MYA-4622 / CBS 123669 / FGSC 9596 / NRRL 45880 / 77-13-4) TaxID=660122 RepID=C7ZMQ1_FUSV7|nr:uncharacterized protein NECHADRAFT_87026 [Fusarium vanettenii 77-13-4]EEU34710.1 hypothetical protein NECHADRAFT_87026 [Fusarium vanettenii 77-13-4]
MAKTTYYAVYNGVKPGIYTSYDESKEQTDRFSKNKYKSFSTWSDAHGWMEDLKKKEQEENRRLEEKRKQHMLKEGTAQKRLESEPEEAPDLLRQTGVEPGTIEHLLDLADRRAFPAAHGKASHQSDAGPSNHSTDNIPASLEATEGSRGAENQSAGFASSLDTDLDARPSKKLKLSEEADSNDGNRKPIPNTIRNSNSRGLPSFQYIHKLIWRVNEMKATFTPEKKAHLRLVMSMIEFLLGRLVHE